MERIYLRDMHVLETEARVTALVVEESRTGVILDRSPFHPQGGGQPADHGVIEGASGALVVDDVRARGTDVIHYGVVEGSLEANEMVRAKVDANRRLWMSRLHSAGHVVDMAVSGLGLDWRPAKGYHFPDGPYVEYIGSLGDRVPDQLQRGIESAARLIVDNGCPVTLRFVRADSGDAALRFMPPSLGGSDEVRVVEYGSFAVPCGGTHVRDLREVGVVSIRKLREKNGLVRVSYALEPTLTEPNG